MIVVDCSALVDVLTSAPAADALRDLLSGEELHVPDLIDYEVVAALRGLVLGGKLGAARAEDALGDFDDLPLHRWQNDAAFRRRAFTLRDVLSAYDAAYLVLAEALACPLATRDRRLARSTGHGVTVVTA